MVPWKYHLVSLKQSCFLQEDHFDHPLLALIVLCDSTLFPCLSLILHWELPEGKVRVRLLHTPGQRCKNESAEGHLASPLGWMVTVVKEWTKKKGSRWVARREETQSQ
jgi:hypothetical protein